MGSVQGGAGGTGVAAGYGNEETVGEELLRLLQQQEPNINRVLSCLYGLEEPWSYAYTSNALSHLNIPPGYPEVYLRPGVSLSRRDLIKDEDYFYSHSKLLEYLRVQMGVQAGFTEQSTTKKPRTTRSGRRIAREGGEDKSDDGLVTRGSRSPASPAETVGFKKRKTAQSPEQPFQQQQQQQQQQQTSVVPAGNLKQAIDGARLALRHASNGQHYAPSASRSCAQGIAFCGTQLSPPPLGRVAEYCQVMQTVTTALAAGQGTSLYLCGSPGMGKTFTAERALGDVQRLVAASGAPSHAHLRVVVLNGSQLRQRAMVFEAISHQLDSHAIAAAKASGAFSLARYMPQAQAQSPQQVCQTFATAPTALATIDPLALVEAMRACFDSSGLSVSSNHSGYPAAASGSMNAQSPPVDSLPGATSSAKKRRFELGLWTGLGRENEDCAHDCAVGG